MKLQRIISNKGVWIPQIDGLRFLAIMGVLCGHTLGELINGHNGYHQRILASDRALQANHLGVGVQLFFVISGFILSRPFVRRRFQGGKPVELGAFYLRRVTRLEPPYILSLIIYAVAHLLFFSAAGKGSLITSMLLSMGYIHNFFSSIPPLNLATWSLEVEIQFYLIAPLLATVFLIRHTTFRRAILVVAITAFALAPSGWADRIGFYLFGNMCYFLAGYLLADMRAHERFSPRYLWDIASVVLFQRLFFSDLSRGALCLVLFLFFIAAMSGTLSRKFLGLRFVAIVGGMCYSIYLMHMLILSAIFRLTSRLITYRSLALDYSIQLAIMLPAVVAISALYFIAIERPCMDPKWPSKLWVWLQQHGSKTPQPETGETV